MASDSVDTRQLYLDLLKQSLLNGIYFENGMRISYLLMQMDTSQPYDLEHVLHIDAHEPDVYESIAGGVSSPENYRERLFAFPMTMIGRPRLDNVEACLKQILEDNIPGDCMETGVWRGGCTIFMRGLLKAYGVTDRTVWVADSFQGVPEPTMPQDEGLNLHLDTKLAVPLETVRENFRRYSLLDEQVAFLPGWFEETMVTAPVEKLALLRLDGDLYSSTISVLEAMYDKVADGGFVIVDDYAALAPCRQATDDFREARGISDPVQPIDWAAVYWRKNA